MTVAPTPSSASATFLPVRQDWLGRRHQAALESARAGGPEELRPLGETEFVNGVAAMSASGGYGKTRACAGIVGHVDLRLGARAKPVLEAHMRVAGDRFRGIRHSTAWAAE